MTHQINPYTEEIRTGQGWGRSRQRWLVAVTSATARSLVAAPEMVRKSSVAALRSLGGKS